MKRSRMLFSVVFVLLFNLSLAACCTVFNIGCPPVLSPDEQNAFVTINDERQRSENYVEAGKTKYNKDAQKVEELQRLYNNAKVPGNSLIELIILNVEDGTTNETLYKSKAADIVKTNQILEAFVYPKPNISEKFVPLSLLSPEVISGAIEGLVKAAVMLRQEAIKEHQQKVDTMAKRLRENSWKDWGKL